MKFKHTIFAILIIACATVVAAPLEKSQGHGEYECQIFTDGDLLLVEVHRGKRIYRFILDTAAPQTAVDSTVFKELLLAEGEVAARKAIRENRWMQKVKNPKDFFVGGKLPLISESLQLIDLGSVSAICGVRIDGVLGCDFLNNYVVQLDFDQGRLIIGQDLPKSVGTPHRLFRDERGCPVIKSAPSRSDGETQDYRIDVAAIVDQEITLNRLQFQEFVNAGSIVISGHRGSAVSPSGIPYRQRRGRLQGFDLWHNSSEELRVAENNTETRHSITLRYLLRFNLTIDLPGATIYVASRRMPPPPPREHDKSGFDLVRYGDTVIVNGVVPQSPAAQNDIRKWDVIVSVNSIPTSEYRLFPLRTMFSEEGKSIPLVVRRGTKERLVNLQLVDYRKPVTKSDFE